jgi:hypothetical protein
MKMALIREFIQHRCPSMLEFRFDDYREIYYKAKQTISDNRWRTAGIRPWEETPIIEEEVQQMLNLRENQRENLKEGDDMNGDDQTQNERDSNERNDKERNINNERNITNESSNNNNIPQGSDSDSSNLNLMFGDPDKTIQKHYSAHVYRREMLADGICWNTVQSLTDLLISYLPHAYLGKNLWQSTRLYGLHWTDPSFMLAKIQVLVRNMFLLKRENTIYTPHPTIDVVDEVEYTKSTINDSYASD